MYACLRPQRARAWARVGSRPACPLGKGLFARQMAGKCRGILGGGHAEVGCDPHHASAQGKNHPIPQRPQGLCTGEGKQLQDGLGFLPPSLAVQNLGSL